MKNPPGPSLPKPVQKQDGCYAVSVLVLVGREQTSSSFMPTIAQLLMGWLAAASRGDAAVLAFAEFAFVAF